jgi:hypothetical protein
MPQAENATFNEVYRTVQGDGEDLIGWSFRVTLRQDFDYSRYPLDRQRIRFELWHVDFEHDVYLVPDLDGYTSTDPATRPGLDDDLPLEGWNIQGSQFAYKGVTYDSDFGIDDYDGAQPQPELRFEVLVKRDLLGEIIGRLLAPAVILLQLFVIVMVIGRDTGRLEKFGIRPGAVIFTCAALFLTVLVVHNALRDSIDAPGLVYLEVVPLLTYLAIFTVALNSVLLVANPDNRLFRHDNLLVEVAFWPVLTGAMLVATIIAFGPRFV